MLVSPVRPTQGSTALRLRVVVASCARLVPKSVSRKVTMPVLSGECDLETHPRKLLISFNSLGGVPKETQSAAKPQRRPVSTDSLKAMASFPLPPVNMVATNVPGPQVPLYAMGKRMIDYYPYVPVGYAVGCGCAIMSYDERLYFGLTADAQAMPDVESFKAFLEESFAELRKAAGLAEIKPQVMKAVKPRRSNGLS